MINFNLERNEKLSRMKISRFEVFNFVIKRMVKKKNFIRVKYSKVVILGSLKWSILIILFNTKLTTLGTFFLKKERKLKFD